MEHIEEAGIHSGDSSCVVPPPFLSDRHIATIRDYTRRIAKALKVIGLMNAQYAIKDDTVYVLEVNPRASRTVPYLSKANGQPLAQIAARVMAGKSLADLGVTDDSRRRACSLSPVFLLVRFGVGDLGPEMNRLRRMAAPAVSAWRSQGDAWRRPTPSRGRRRCITVNNEDKNEVFRRPGTGRLVSDHGTRGTVPTCGRTVSIARWSSRSTRRPSLADEIVNGRFDGHQHAARPRSFFDDKAVRRAAMMAGVPCITTITSGRRARSDSRSRRKASTSAPCRTTTLLSPQYY
jgi:carbamoyl-phosphate synthase large subunit